MITELVSGLKYDGEKPRHALLSGYSLTLLAKVATHGAEKYEDHNWRKGIKWSRMFSAALRHLWAFWMGRENDEESGLPHLAHAMWNCMALLEHTKLHPGMDDRFIDPTM